MLLYSIWRDPKPDGSPGQTGFTTLVEVSMHVLTGLEPLSRGSTSQSQLDGPDCCTQASETESDDEDVHRPIDPAGVRQQFFQGLRAVMNRRDRAVADLPAGPQR